MRTIKIVEILGNPVLLAPDKGERIRKEIEEATTPVAVDFDGYKFISSTFLNHAFGQLCINMQWSGKVFFEKVIITNLQEDDYDELLLAIDNAEARLEMMRKGINPKDFFATHLPA